jgi:hypothetical protein
MSDQNTLHEEPLLQTYTSDLGARGRIRELDGLIAEDPIVFMAACRELGGEAVKHMANQDTELSLDTERVQTVVPKLSEFLRNNDLLHVDFDPDSDTAVYGDPSVRRMISTVQGAKSRIKKQGSKHIVEENPNAVGLRDGLSALKLYLFAKRKADWARQQASANTTMGHNGAA